MQATRMPANAVSGSPSFDLGDVPVMAVPDDGDDEPASRRRSRSGLKGQGLKTQARVECAG